MRASVSEDRISIWLVDQNPLNLPEPPAWWQRLVYQYDKMLRILPSQKDYVYRLCRVVRREAQLGLNAMVVHDHPDTRACIKFGVVPVAAVHPWAVRSDKILRDLRARDTWMFHGGDPHKITDMLDAQERDVEAARQRDADADFDERSHSAYRAIRYGRPELFDLRAAHRRAARTAAVPLSTLPILPELSNPLAQSGGIPVSSRTVPPADSPAAARPTILLTDRD